MQRIVSSIAPIGFIRRNHLHFSGSCDTGYITGVIYIQICSAYVIKVMISLYLTVRDVRISPQPKAKARISKKRRGAAAINPLHDTLFFTSI